jgi:hypothetical protein
MTDAMRLHYSNPSVLADPFAVYEVMHANASVVRSEKLGGLAVGPASTRRTASTRNAGTRAVMSPSGTALNYCIGAALARIEADLDVPTFLDHLGTIELSRTDSPGYVPAPITRTLSKLPLRVAH